MRKLIFLLIICTSISMTAQKHKISPHVAYWQPSDFPKGISKVETYEFKIKNGKIKKDSLLIGSANLDKGQVTGILYNLMCMSHAGCERDFQEYKRIYSPSGQLLLSKHEKRNKSVEKGKHFLDYDYHISETKYKYDELGNKIEELYFYTDLKFALDRKTKDTIDIYLTTQPTTYSYVYDESKLLSHYTQKDSVITRRVFLDIDTTSVSASYHYQPRYKNIDNLYDESGQLSCLISYTREGKFHTKRYYYYDDKLRIVKQIDSTGWYMHSIKPYAESQVLYDYIHSGLIKTVERFKNHFDNGSKTIIKYNLKDQIISECRQYENGEHCDYYDYTFNGDKVVEMIHTDSKGRKIYSYFKYDRQGLLIEEKDIVNNKISSIVRYYYK